METAPATCLNCGKVLKEKHRFCPKCGQSAKVGRLSFQEVRKNLQKRILHAESDILQLTWGLAVRPGLVVLEYVRGKRKKYYNPLKYLTLSAGVSVFINEYFRLLENVQFQALDNAQGHTNPGTEIATRFFNLIILFSVPVSAVFSWLLFRKRGFNFTENLVLHAYLGGFRTVFFILIFTPLVVCFREHYFQVLITYLGIWVVYLSWAMVQFFGGPVWKTALKAILLLLFNQIVVTAAITLGIFIQRRF